MSISLQHFRDVLDDLKIKHAIHKKENLIEFVITDEEPCKLEVVFFFTVDEKQSLILGKAALCSCKLDHADNFRAAYFFCNKWNTDTMLPKAEVIEDKEIILCEWVWDTDYPVTDEMLKGLIINPFITYVFKCVKKAIKAELYLELAFPFSSEIKPEK